jgi:hypothetical protein
MNANMKVLVTSFRDAAIDELRADPQPDHAEIVRVACTWLKQQEAAEKQAEVEAARKASLAKANAAIAARAATGDRK